MLQNLYQHPTTVTTAESEAMTQPLVFRGGQPFNKRKRESLARQLNVTELYAVYEYHVALHKGLAKGVPTPENVKTLNDGLTGGSESLEPIQPSSLDPTFKVFYVAPRTTSPWSSNATNIVHVWGFNDLVKRVERLTRITVKRDNALEGALAAEPLFDRMTQTFIEAEGGNFPNPERLFEEVVPAPAQEINLKNVDKAPENVLEEANKSLKLSLDRSEIEYLVKSYAKIGRNPTDVELFMFAQ